MVADAGATLMLQPDDAISDNQLTAAQYGSGAQGILGQSYENDDPTHMNAAYGKLVLDQIGNVLSATPATAPA